MKSKNRHRFTYFVTLVLSILCVQAVSAKELVSLDGAWQFALGPTTEERDKGTYPDEDSIKKVFKEVEVPHTWNDYPVDRVNAGEGFHLSKGWYKKSFRVHSVWEGKRLFLRFEGVGFECWVKLNGKEIGEHQGAYSAFCFEITDSVIFGKDNLLEVTVSNLKTEEFMPAAERLQTRFGGIYRRVKLLVAEPSCISPMDYASSGVYLHQSNVSKKSADLVIETVLDSKENLSAAILSAVIKGEDGKVVETVVEQIDVKAGSSNVSLKTTLKNPQLWNGRKNPYLYSVEVSLSGSNKRVLDQVVQPLGLRFFEFTSTDGFFLNGEYLDVTGVSRWQDWAEEGFATTEKHDQKDVELMLELNCKGIRFACYQQSDNMYDLMDQNGFVCLAEIAVTPPNVSTDEYHASCRQQLKELIKQQYNHPSIILWNLLNEVSPKAEHLMDLHNLAHELDGSRPTAIVYNRNIKNEEEANWHKIPDLICSNKYPWWYEHYGDVLANAGVFNDRYQNLKKYLPNVIFGVTEFGAGGCVTQHQQNPEKPDPIKGRFYPEEYQTMIHERQWALLRDHKEYWCKLIWNLTDFTWAWVARGDAVGRNHKGLVTHDRKIKKDVFYFYKAQWNDAVPTLYIASRRHAERIEAVTPVKIYSNCPEVTLTVNGIEIGTISNPDYNVFQWPEITLQKGVNTISVEGIWNGKKQVDSCSWILN